MPCLRSLEYSYLPFVSEERNEVGFRLNQATPLLEYKIIDLLSGMLWRAQVAASLAARMLLTKDVVLLVSFDAYGLRPFVYIGVADPKCPYVAS